MSLTHAEWLKLRDMINAWPDDGDRIAMHRVINREKLHNPYVHNHVTRDIKKPNAGCPACDFYWDRER